MKGDSLRIQSVPLANSPVQHGAATVMVGIAQAGRAVTHETTLDLSPLVKNDESTTPLTTTSGRWIAGKPGSLTTGTRPHENRTASMRKKQPPLKTSALQVVKAPGDGSCFFHAVACTTPHRVQELRLVADAVIPNAETRFNGLTVREWIQTEIGMTPDQYADDMRKNGWGGQVDMHLLAQLLHTSFHVYIKSESGILTHQYTFEPTPDLQHRMTLPEPIRMMFDNKHYDAIVKHIHVEDNIASKNMHKPPAQVEQITNDLGPMARKTDEVVAPQAIVRADNDEWIIVGMRSKGNAQKQCTRTTEKDQHCNALPGQTSPFAPGSGGQVNGLKTDFLGALDPISPNDQLGRDVMGRTITTDGVQRMTPRIQLAQTESPYRPGLEGLTTQETVRANYPL